MRYPSDFAFVWCRDQTYFRHQSPDYRPGEGFVAVGAAEA
jgi:hypothetical protein